jgi:hypothetical protein
LTLIQRIAFRRSGYEQVAPNLPPDVYRQSAQEVFAQLTPEQRMQLG